MKLKCTNKECQHKGKLQDSSNFYSQKGTLKGYQSHCKDCYREKYKSNPKENQNNWMNLFMSVSKY